MAPHVEYLPLKITTNVLSEINAKVGLLAYLVDKQIGCMPF
jgi:hypothetical protein